LNDFGLIWPNWPKFLSAEATSGKRRNEDQEDEIAREPTAWNCFAFDRFSRRLLRHSGMLDTGCKRSYANDCRRDDPIAPILYARRGLRHRFRHSK
jgi:hypothetical protein